MQPLKGLPQTSHSSLTPSGEIEQATKIAEGWKQSRSGWRKAVFVTGVAVLALMALSLLVFAVLRPA